MSECGDSNPEWEEWSAVFHIMQEMKRRKKPIKTTDIHSLVVKTPAVKAFLMSKWKLSNLHDFILKYPQYFKIEKDGATFLREPDVLAVELESIAFFIELLRKRNNRPIHVLNAACFVCNTAMIDHLKASYNTEDLSSFFQAHLCLFEINERFVSLRTPTDHHSPLKPQESKETVSPPIPTLPQNEAEKDTYLEKRAVDFYTNVIAKYLIIPVDQAHSYLQKDFNLHNYLKKNYKISDLSPFFAKYPKHFVVTNKHVSLSANVNLPNSSSSIVPAVFTSQSKGSTGKASPVPSLSSTCSSNEPTTKKKKKSNSQNVRTTGKASPTPPSSSTSSTNEPLKKNKVAKEAKNNNSTTVEKKDIPVRSKLNTVDSEQVKQSYHVTENESLQKLLLLLKTSSSSSNAGPVKQIQSESSSKFKDVACQTVSSGPVLSLNFFQESKNIS